MPTDSDNCLSLHNRVKNDVTLQLPAESEGMGVEDRRAVVLGLLEESGVAMRSTDIARNCKLRGATFEHRSVKNYLTHWRERGQVLKVDPHALSDGEIVEIPSGERGHWIAASVATEIADE